MVIDKHLKELALSNRRVIIPDLGAFLSKEGDGDEKNLIFSSFLKYNDGFLEKQLAEKENISQSQAADEIKKFVDEVTKTLHAKQNYAIDNLGFFHMDERGSIAFAPQGTKISTKPVEEKSAVAVPAMAVASSTPKEKPANQKSESTTAVSPSQKAEQTNGEEPKVEQPAVKPLTPQQTTPVTPLSSTPVPPQQTPPAKQQPAAKSSNNNGLLITVIILLLVILALLLLYFMVPSIKEKVNSMFGAKSTTTEQFIENHPGTPPATDTIPAVDTTKQDQIETTQVVKDENVATKTASTYSSNYYVIVGTFQEKSNAEKLYKRCIADGYDAELLPKMGPLYPVSIFNSPSKAECTKVMREAQHKYGDAWIFKSKRH